MDKNQNDNRTQNDGMSKEKTNQDYNKMTPNPNDPNQKKTHQIGEEEGNESKKREVTANTGHMPNDPQRDHERRADIPNRNEDSARTSSGYNDDKREEDDKNNDNVRGSSNRNADNVKSEQHMSE